MGDFQRTSRHVKSLCDIEILDEMGIIMFDIIVNNSRLNATVLDKDFILKEYRVEPMR